MEETMPFDSILPRLQSLMKREPSNPAVFSSLGYTYHHLGDTTKSVECFNKYMELEPQNNSNFEGLRQVISHVWYNWGQTMLENGDTTSAIKYFKQSLDISKGQNIYAQAALSQFIEQSSIEAKADSTVTGKSLNDIRFEGWERENWLDNEYIRSVRKYLNKYINGNISNHELDQYKQHLNSKFVVGDIQPYFLGGAFIQIIFLDMPDRVFNCWVYSDVDETTEKVSNYSVRSIHIDNKVIDYTKYDILQTVTEHPELKLW